MQKEHLECTNLDKADALRKTELASLVPTEEESSTVTDTAIQVLSSMVPDWEADNYASTTIAGLSSWRRSSRTAAVRISTASKLKQKDTRVRPVSYSVRKHARSLGKPRSQRGLFLNWLNKTRQNSNNDSNSQPTFNLMKPREDSNQLFASSREKVNSNRHTEVFSKGKLPSDRRSKGRRHVILPSLV